MFNKKKNLLFIGPFPPPIHGESMAMDLIYNSEELHQLFNVKKINTNRRNIENQGRFSISKLIMDVFIMCYAWVLTLVLKSPTIYISISQSKLGLLRDCIIIYIASLLRAKVITHLHGNNLSNIIGDLNKFQRKFVECSLRKIEIGIVLGESLAFNYRGLVKKVGVVSNGVATNFITSEDLKGKSKSKDIRVLYLSNLISSKGYVQLIEAISDLIQEDYHIKLNLVGGIHDKKTFLDVKKKIQMNNLEDSIVYHGIKAGEEKKKYFLNADMMVLPTNYKIEGQPISIIEGMAAGLCIISTNRGAIPEMLENCGIIIEPEVGEIKNAIKELYHNAIYREKLGLASRLKYENYYTDKKFINNLIDIFTEVS